MYENAIEFANTIFFEDTPDMLQSSSGVSTRPYIINNNNLYTLIVNCHK